MTERTENMAGNTGGTENMERVLVCGGRDFTDSRMMARVLDEMTPQTIIHGAAKGADSLAGRYARSRHIPCREFPVNWHDRRGNYNPKAAFDRNQQMLNEGNPTLVVAFPGGGGTRHMVRISREQGFQVLTITHEGKVQGRTK